MIKLFRNAESVKVTIPLPADEAVVGCSVVGDFNGWRPGMHQLRRRSNGTRSIAVTLPLGTRIRFRYLGKNGHWFNDPDVVEFDGRIRLSRYRLRVAWGHGLSWLDVVPPSGSTCYTGSA